MTKRLTAKVGEYQKDGQTKGRYVDLGVILSNSNGEYVLLDPTVNLAGVMLQQRILAQATGKKAGDRVMCSVFNNDRQQDNPGGGQGAVGGGFGGGGSGGSDLDGDDVPFQRCDA